MKRLIFGVILVFLISLISVVAAPQPGVCYFGDSNGDCVITGYDFNQAKKAVLLRPADYSGVIPQSPDVQDVNGDGVIDLGDLNLIKGLMMLKTSNLAGVPKKVVITEIPTQLDINSINTITVSVTDEDGTPRAGIGVLFTIDESSAGSATLTGRNPADGDNIITSDSVFELTNTISEGGRATITINPLSAGTVIIKTFVPGDATKGVDDVNGEDIVIEIVDGLGTTTNKAPVFDAIPGRGAYSNELIEFVISATDDDNDVLTYNLVSGPGNFDSATQTYTWTPLQSDKKESVTRYYLIFNASDGISTVETNTRIDLVNRVPVISDISDLDVDEDDLVSVSHNFYDPDGDILTISFTSPLDYNGEWQTDYDSEGSYLITAIVSDGINSASKTFNLIVNDKKKPENSNSGVLGGGYSGSSSKITESKEHSVSPEAVSTTSNTEASNTENSKLTENTEGSTETKTKNMLTGAFVTDLVKTNLFITAIVGLIVLIFLGYGTYWLKKSIL